MIRNKGLYLIVLPIFILFFQCTQNRRDDSTRIFTLDEFATKTLIPEINKAISLSNPSRITLCKNHSVIIAEKKSPIALRLIDLESGDCCDSVVRGRGPGECLSSWDITIVEDKVFVYDILGQKIVVFSLENDNRLFFENEIEIKEPYLRIIPSPTGGFVALPHFKGRIVYLSDEGIPRDTVGSFPLISGDKRAVNNSAAQSQIAFSTDGNHFCSSYLLMNYIEIYSGNEMSIRLWGPKQLNPSVKISEVSGGTMYLLEPTTKVFSGLSGSETGFIVGYVGKSFNNQGDFNNIQELLLFDWEGNPLRRYILPINIIAFDVDWKENKIMTITSDSNPLIVSFHFDH